SLSILGPERKLFFFAMCLGAATKNGHRFLAETQSAGKGQVLYHGFTRPLEATTPISTGSIKRPRRRTRGREAEISASFSTTKEAPLPRSREARSWQAFFRAKPSRYRTAWSSG